jgi:DNA-binding NarL/FixJ family response regulator
MADGDKIRVLIVDDIQETRDNLAKLLGFEKNMAIAGMAASGQEAIELAKKEFKNFVSAIIQADQLGVSMSKVLRIQSEQLRQERRQRAEEKAARAPILIMLPTVGCIFPSLFIVILGPAVLSAMSTCGSV